MSPAGHIGRIFAACLLALGVICISAGAQSDDAPAPQPAAPADTAPSDLLFNEIQLDRNGVTAVDTAGDDWHFDFEHDVFVTGTTPGEGGVPHDQRINQNQPPVEERATRELKVRAGEKSVIVGYDEYVDGSIFAYGRVTVKGWVRGDVKSVNSRVLITETGRVDGDVEAPEVVVKEGGEVLGRIEEIGAPLEGITEGISADGLVVVLVLGLVVIFFGFLIVALMPRQLANFSSCLVRHRVKCYLLGFLFLLMMPFVIVLCVITLVGIVVIPFVPMLYLGAMLMGLVSFGAVVGSAVMSRLQPGGQGAQVKTLLGEFLLMVLWLLVVLMMSAANPVQRGLGIALLVISIVITSYPLLTGIGAALLTRFGHRQYVSFTERRPDIDVPPAPAPPPLYDPPPIVTPGPTPPPPPLHDRDESGPPSQQS